MNEAGFDVDAMEMDLSSRQSILEMIDSGRQYGEIKMLVNAAGVSPSQAPIERILRVGSTFLIDGGATASYYYGDLKPQNQDV